MTLCSFLLFFFLFAGPTNAEDGDVRDVLYIAMAGTHQIWALYIKDSTWLKGRLVNMLVNCHLFVHPLKVVNCYVHWLNRLSFHSLFFVSSFIMCCHSQIMIFEATVTPDFFL